MIIDEETEGCIFIPKDDMRKRALWAAYLKNKEFIDNLLNDILEKSIDGKFSHEVIQEFNLEQDMAIHAILKSYGYELESHTVIEESYRKMVRYDIYWGWQPDA